MSESPAERRGFLLFRGLNSAAAVELELVQLPGRRKKLGLLRGAARARMQLMETELELRKVDRFVLVRMTHSRNALVADLRSEAINALLDDGIKFDLKTERHKTTGITSTFSWQVLDKVQEDQ